MLHSYSSIRKMRNLFLLSLGLGVAPAALAQTAPTPIAIGSATAVYTQNFDGMGATGTSYPDGWTGLRLSGAGTATVALTVSDGSGTSGSTYNVGTSGSSDRALGSIGSANTIPAFGAVFTNGSGAAITRVNIAFRAEQWRLGELANQDEVLAFEYSLDATSLSTGTWTAATALNVPEILNTPGGQLPVVGNEDANSRAISSFVSGLNWPAGTTMWIRWKDANDNGTDALLAIDNFAISTGATPLSTRAITKNGSALSVFPNPVTDIVSIQVNSRGVQTPVVVTDLAGRTVLRSTAAADGTLSLRSLPAGSYILLVQDGATTSTYKVVKQ